MEPRNRQTSDSQPQEGRHENPLPQEISSQQRSLDEAAHREAEKDIDNDAEFSSHGPNDDLDEGETSRLGENVPV